MVAIHANIVTFKCLFAVIVGIALLCLFPAPAAAQVVSVTGGSVQGKTLDDGSEIFRGIPFAAPPVENLRWKPPQPVGFGRN